MMNSPYEKNQIDVYLDRLLGEMRKAYDELTPKLQGGRKPPRTVATAEAEQLAAYVLLAQDPARLPPAERAQWDTLREDLLAGRSRAELEQYVVAMERLRAEVTGQQEFA